ncbi:peroxin 12 [Klebsormidium nitens]|uniref:Peroxin-12 n=1 Tax=Klebsormidium nitens TaxID=105231 RepID=A0A1Y1IDB5_KLENI|nr:peroxin 12 [Klebsormidium nitens]|eukprot:GAQ88910.1 peroxin 12 [Klebsormidium nitens]
MLFQVGGDGSRPTFFEMSATEHLPLSLRTAMQYSLAVLAQRQPALHKVLDHADEAFAVLMLALEYHSLRTQDASFAEALYGLRRTPARVQALPPGQQRNAPPSSGLGRKQRLLSLLFLVGLPYLRTKFRAAYSADRRGTLQSGIWQGGEADANGFANGDGSTDALLGEDPFDSEIEASETATLETWQGWRVRLGKAMARAYPLIHTSVEGLCFGYQLMYLLDVTRYYSPMLRGAGVVVRRSTGQELLAAAKRSEELRRGEFGRLRGPAVLQWLQRFVFRTGYTFLDSLRNGLIVSVFLFKMLEWWYTSAEQRVNTPTILPPPPAPPAPKAAEGGISLPRDKHLCPLCQRPRTNPAMAAFSGFVFCYPCIFQYVNQYERCPVTLMPMEVDNIRRLYLSA